MTTPEALLAWLREHTNHHVKPMTEEAGMFLACFTCDPDNDFIILRDHPPTVAPDTLETTDGG